MNKKAYRTLLMIGLASISLLTSADCVEDCKQAYEACMENASAINKSKICAQIRRDCQLECAGV